jgi:hypothetical protein
LALSGAAGVAAPGVVAVATLDGMQALSANRSDESGIVHLYLRIRKPPGRYNVTVSFPGSATMHSMYAAINIVVHVRGCIPGEVAPIEDTCEPCVPGFYSLDPRQAVCDACPAGASCPGGAAMVPLPGWWHSAADSAQMHR